MTPISDAKILFIATNGFEQSELFGPRQALIDAGAEVILASESLDDIQGVEHDKPGKAIKPDMLLGDVEPDDYDALVIPGGVANPDRLRTIDEAVDIVRAFDDAGKPIAAICHGPWMLVEADIVEDRTVTSWPSIRTDLENAGAEVVDDVVVVDGNLITSRMPDDVPEFSKAIIRMIEEGVED